MEDPTLNKLIRNTELFFEHHWNVDLLGKPPEWSPVHFNFGKFLITINKVYMRLSKGI